MARRRRTLQIAKKAVGIDSNYEPVTKAAFEYREAHVYPYLIAKGLTVEKLQGALARRGYVAPKAKQAGVVYLTGVGHGAYDSYTGHIYDPIFTVGQYLSSESQGKIVHLLSCQTGRDLGPDFVQNGCKAYFGYDENFTFFTDTQDIFFECDSEIDLAFADGLTAEQVYTRVVEKFQHHIDAMYAAGKIYVAEMLAYNRDHLRCPSSGGSDWGNPKAKL